MSLYLNFTEQSIRASARLDIRPLEQNIDFFFLHLKDLAVDSAFINGLPATFLRLQDKIYFQPGQLDSIFQVRIDYSGRPGNDGFGGFFFNGDYAFTIGEGINTYPPSMMRYWIPGNDVPGDKATVTMHLTIPSNSKAFSNGKLTGSVDNRDGCKTVTWQENHPISTYLIAVAVGPYETFSLPYSSITGSDLPLEFYTFPEHLQTAQEDWRMITKMMAFYENAFAPYPFDRYSMAEAFNRGAMEHQTMTTYSSQLITGDHRYDYIVAHELAHHWWGDLVTIADWRDLWLNEGFATYSEALYYEHLYGTNFYQEYMQNLAEIYYAEVTRRGHFSIYDPDYLWGGTIYQKGAWVLHMLRWTIGDEAFWRTLHQYAKIYAYANALTTDFIAVAENQSGQDLDWFFNQWVYQPGYPDLDVSWDFEKSNNSSYKAVIKVEQKQWDKFQFRLPLDIIIETDQQPHRDTLWVDASVAEFYVQLDARPLSIAVDPDHWLLHQHDIISEPKPPGISPGDFYLAQNYPNPFISGEETTILFYVPQLNSPHAVSIQVYNILGQHVVTLYDKQVHGGYYTVKWNATDAQGRRVPKGVYIVHLQSNEHLLERKLVILD